MVICPVIQAEIEETEDLIETKEVLGALDQPELINSINEI